MRKQRLLVAALAAVAATLIGWPSAQAQVGPSISSGRPPAGVVGSGYLHQFTVSPPVLDATYHVTSGSLPPGLVLSLPGFLTGVPIAAGTFGPTTVCATSLVARPACQTFLITVQKRIPSILAAPSPGVVVGTPVRETATLVGAFLPTGTMTFRLFSDPACKVQVFTSTNVLSAAGAAISDDFVTMAPGVYRWVVTYSGDANNERVSTVCDVTNSVAVLGVNPPTTTSTTTTVPPTTTTTLPPTTTTTTTSTTTTTLPPTTTTTTTTLPPTTTTTSTTTTTTTLPPTTTTTTTTLPPTTTTTLPPTTTTTTLPSTTTTTTLPPTTTTSTTTTLPPTTTTLPPTTTTLAPTTTTTSTTLPPTTTTTSTTTTLPPTTTTTSTTTTTLPPTTTTTTTTLPPTTTTTSTTTTTTTLPPTTTTSTSTTTTTSTTVPPVTTTTVAPGAVDGLAGLAQSLLQLLGLGVAGATWAASRGVGPPPA